jgi:sterol desaturase/sphingolipid hydroxylase (fatty acid hydroxylase superfamily)
MESIIEYFSTITSAHRSAILIGGLMIFFLLENALPLFTGTHNKWKHSGLNIFFTFTTILVNFFMAFILVGTSDWVVAENVGLLQVTSDNVYYHLIVGLLALDLIGAWLPHWIAHHVKWIWQFHLIHHTDQHVDTTTANRHHPGESLFRFVFTTLAVLVIGAPMWLVFLYQSLSVVLTQFNHSNLKIAEWLDNPLSYVICTPNMHRVHHHYRQPYSDSNYGNIFSFWDRIFDTYLKVDNTKLIYGVDTHMELHETQSIGNLLKIPFSEYRPHIEYDEEEKL